MLHYAKPIWQLRWYIGQKICMKSHKQQNPEPTVHTRGTIKTHLVFFFYFYYVKTEVAMIPTIQLCF